jgi:hypothetical protein
MVLRAPWFDGPHTLGVCGTGEHEEDELQYGEWMMALSESWRPGTPWTRDFSTSEKSMPHPQGRREDRGGRSGFAGRFGRGSMSGGGGEPQLSGERRRLNHPRVVGRGKGCRRKLNWT